MPRDLHALVWVGALFVAITIAGGVVGFADDVLSTWVSERFLLDLRTRFYAHLQTLPLDFFEGRRLGDVLSRLTGDIQAIESFVLSGVADALSYALRVLFFAGALFYLQWDLALVALVVGPVFYVAARRTAALLKRASREKRRRSGSIGAVAEEGLANMALVQAYGREDTERERFHAQNLGAFRAQMTATRLRAGFGPLVELIELAGVLLVMAYGTVKLSQGALSLGGLLVFMAYLSKLFSPVRGLSRLTTGLFSASAAAERVIEFLDERPAVADPPAPLPAGRRRGDVRFEDVRFTYPGATGDALRGVDLEVGPGEVLALVGPSGAGKSTVARLLLRFADPSAGRVLLDGSRPAGRPRSPTCAPTSRSCSRRRSSSTRRCSRTSPTGAPGRRARRSRRRRARPMRTTSSRPCRTATTAASASAGGGCRAASASGSPWRAR